MSLELFEKDLVDITEKISKLELKQTEEKKSWKAWFWSDNDYSHQKVHWQSLENDIKRKIDLIKQIPKENHSLHLISKFSSQLAKVEEQIAKIEIDINSYREQMKEANKSVWITIILLAVIFIAFLIFMTWLKTKD